MTELITEKRLRIMLLIKSLSQGGAERQCCQLAEQLADAGHSVCVVVYSTAHMFYRDLLPPNVNLVSLGRRRWNIPGLLFGLRRQTLQFKPDVLYSFMSHSNLLAIALKHISSFRVVCGIRSSDYDLRTEPVHARFGEWLHRLALRNADLIIANSYAAKAEMSAEGIPSSGISVVANGIDSDRFRFKPEARCEFRQRLGYSDTDFVIGMFARLHPMKGYAVLLKAFSDALGGNPNLKLLMIGRGGRDKIDTEIKAYGLQKQVLLLDERRDIENYYSAIDLYCSPSLYGESFPNALSEALSVGLPCIATDVGDSALIMAGLGRVIDANDAGQLRDAIIHAAVRSTESEPEARRQHIVRNYGLHELGGRTIRTLLNMMES